MGPTLLQIIGAVFYFLVFPDDFAPAEAFQRNMTSEGYREFQQDGSPYAGVIINEISESLNPFTAIVPIIIALGEEIGWRGYMYPVLKEGCGRTKGLLAGGVIHGAWHFPAMILAGYEYGKDYIGAPLLGLVVFCIFTAAMGIISDFLYVRSGSIWLPAILHAMINSEASPRMLMGNGHHERSIFGPSDIGLIGMIPMATCAAFLLWYQYKREQMELDELFDENSVSA
jgi:membrane protease YdiL (CAAX protease family)